MNICNNNMNEEVNNSSDATLYMIQIEEILENIPVSFTLTTPRIFRQLLTQFIVFAPITDSCIMKLLNKFNHLCGIKSDSDTYPIHEIMLMYGRHNYGTNIDVIQKIIHSFPEGLQQRNSHGLIPLHCLIIFSESHNPNFEILSLLIHSNPETVRYVIYIKCIIIIIIIINIIYRITLQNSKLPIHMLMKHHNPCVDCLSLLINVRNILLFLYTFKL